MKLSNALASITGSQKTASAETAPSATATSTKVAAAGESGTPSGDRLKQALTAAMTTSAPVAEKQAAAAPASSPIDGITKIASDLANAEHEALLKEAHLYGQAVADGAMARFGQWNEMLSKTAAAALPAAQPTTKIASTDDSFEKFAAENELLVKQAAQVGYDATMNELSKFANDAYGEGFNNGVAAIYKTAHTSFVQGFADTAQLLETLSK